MHREKLYILYESVYFLHAFFVLKVKKIFRRHISTTQKKTVLFVHNSIHSFLISLFAYLMCSINQELNKPEDAA